jgi:predicted PurR-regulated permease PerM
VPEHRTRHRIRIAMVAGALLAIGYMLYAARGALPPFFLGAVFVVAFAPAVDRVALGFPFRQSHPDLALSCSVALLYLAFISVVLAIVAIWGPEVLDEGKSFVNDLPTLASRAQHQVQDSNGWYQRNVPPDVRNQLEKNVDTLAGKAGDYAQQVASRTIDFATAGLATVISYIVVPFWAFFVLKDREKGTQAFISMFPASVQPDVHHLVTNARAVFGSYVRAQLLLCLVTAVVTAAGLRWFGVRFSLALGIVAGIANLIPVIGPMLGAAPALIVATATHPGWRVLWVFLFLFLSQELKDFVLVPRVQGRAVRLHPAVILVLIVVAGHLAGFWGLLLVVPVAAVARDTFVYIYRRLGDQPALVVTEQGAAEPLTPEDRDTAKLLRR